jgi:hypothetical protein
MAQDIGGLHGNSQRTKYYSVDVYPSGNYGDGNCYFAEAISGGTVVSGGCMGWLTIGQFQSITNKLRYSPLSRQKFSENKVDRW